MLNKIINSQTRLKIMDLFFQHPDKKYYNQEITKLVQLDAARVLRELINLLNAGFLKTAIDQRKKVYFLNKNYEFFTELQQLFKKYNYRQLNDGQLGCFKFAPKKNLITKNLALNQTKEWYNQRFDGSAYILFISIAELTKEKRKLNGGAFTSHLIVFENDIGDWFIDQEDINRISNLILEKSLDNKKISKKFLADWRVDEKNYLRLCQEMDKINVAQLSNHQLLNKYKNFIATYLKTITSSSLIDGFSLGTDKLIQTKLSEFLNKQDLAKFQYKYFTILTAPINQSFINEAEISLLKVGVMINKNQLAKKLFLQKNIPAIIKELPRYPLIWSALKKHEHSYYWSKNNYVHNYILDTKHFITELQGLLRGEVNFNKEIKRITETPKINWREKNKLLVKLNPPQIIRNLITISDDFTYWQDERKKRTYLATHHLSILLTEIGQRVGYNLNEMKYLLPNEVLTIFSQQPACSPAEAEARRRYSLFYQKGEDYEFISGPQAKKLQQQIFAAANDSQVNDFRGLPACRGKIQGRVRIIKSVTEVNKIQ